MPAPSVDLTALAADVQWTDRAAGTRTADAMPAALGRLVDLADWLASVQGTAPPVEPRRVRLVQFGRAGSSVVAGLAADLDVGVRLVDELPESPLDALAAGLALADREVDGGADLVAVACPVPVGVAPAVAVSVLAAAEPVRVLERGAAATDPQAWMQRATAVRDLRRRVIGSKDEPEQLLAELGDATLAAAAGFVLQAAVRRTPVLLDGVGATAAGLLAYQVQPRTVRWLTAAGTASDPAQVLAMTTMGLRGILDSAVATGDGIAALIALPALRAAARAAAENPATELPA
ncbi:MAG TPA: nicotinate-nucleotide--dimethylbenzimidazole phosphoribosyltransferase [Jatrophihabitantaceae bacterium]|nr:nicotinate-nucleotide--dimethylbenzimidazole phosphoribosyltransferase [Jatrophihabitantaceae bacterium]